MIVRPSCDRRARIAGRRTQLALMLTAAIGLSSCAGPGAAPRPGPSAGAGAPAGIHLTAQASGTTALLQAVSAVSRDVVWVSGHEGTFARTLDGGRTWSADTVEGADTLQFRDVEAFGPDVAYLLSAGTGELSRIYKTTDGGRSWTLQYVNREPAAFFDCMAFWDERTGIAFSDAVDGRFPILRTADGGATWARLPDDVVPEAQPGEGSFAASGTCAAAGPDGAGWIGTGNAAGNARVLRTADRGRTWEAVRTPLPAGEAAGIASLAFRDGARGVALGGDIGDRESLAFNVVRTDDGGARWILAGRPFRGAVYGAAYLGGGGGATLLAAGPNGVAASRDDGRTWLGVTSATHWAIGAAGSVAWAVGPDGLITRIDAP